MLMRFNWCKKGKKDPKLFGAGNDMIPLKISPELEVWSQCQEIFICSITKAGDTVGYRSMQKYLL